MPNHEERCNRRATPRAPSAPAFFDVRREDRKEANLLAIISSGHSLTRALPAGNNRRRGRVGGERREIKKEYEKRL